jgi:hypothetical protein
MRDGEIMHKFDTLNKQFSTSYRQMVFLDTRLQAFERVFLNRSTLFKSIINPKSILNEVDTLQFALMRKHDEDLRKVREEQASKPNITLVKPIEVFK